jgi:hypothetical protein
VTPDADEALTEIEGRSKHRAAPAACDAVREMRGIAKDTRSRVDQMASGDIVVDVWEERDRLSIRVEDAKTGCVVAEWWDDDARQMFEDGFFEGSIEPAGPPYNVGLQRPSRDLKRSVAEYLDSVKI